MLNIAIVDLFAGQIYSLFRIYNIEFGKNKMTSNGQHWHPIFIISEAMPGKLTNSYLGGGRHTMDGVVKVLIGIELRGRGAVWRNILLPSAFLPG